MLKYVNTIVFQMAEIKIVKMTFEIDEPSKNKFKSICANNGTTVKEALNIAIQLIIKRKNLKNL